MKRITVSEYGRFRRADVSPKALRELQRLDEHEAIRSGDTVLDWGHLSHVRAKSYVGVIQAGGVQIEVLPKLDDTDPQGEIGKSHKQVGIRENLLYMLSVARQLPINERDMANQSSRNLPILDALIRIFASQLLPQLRRGQVHEYQYREEDLHCVRGRVLIRQQLTTNLNQKHKIRVGFDEFSNDTLLNQILLATCRTLIRATGSPHSQQILRECLFELSEVRSRTIVAADFDQIVLRRDAERFRHLLEFCRLVFDRSSPSLKSGSQSSFSLMFPMEFLFEEFVGEFIRKNAESIGFARNDVRLQAKRSRRWLVRSSDGKGRFQLKPDILIRGKGATPQIILDTKWKRLASDSQDSKNGVRQSDMYQLYAYATRYDCPCNILLFPHIAGASQKSYTIDGNDNAVLRVEFLDLNFNLRQNKQRLIDQLNEILNIASIKSPL